MAKEGLVNDLRGFLAKLEDEGELKRVKKEVDWDLRVGAIMRRIFDTDGPAVLFEKVKGSEYPLVSGVMSTFKRYALGIQSPPDLRSICQKVLKATSNPIEPRMVTDGVCKENIFTGSAVDIYKFPTPKWGYLDGGRFIGTLGVMITKDIDTGLRNAGIYRLQIHAKDKVGLMATQQAGVALTKHRGRSKAMPVAVAIGLPPAVLAASSTTVAYGVDELAIAGALQGEPVELVKCETVDLEVPSCSEIVLEGEVPLDETEWEEEGPFGEFTGYYGGLKAKRPVIKLTAVTHRNNPILQGTPTGAPPSEDTVLRTVGHTVGKWSLLLKSGVPGIKEVYLADTGCANFFTIVSVDQLYYAGNVRQIIEACWSMGTSRDSKWVIVVDDIDIYDWKQVTWALGTRVQPHRDIAITDDRQTAINLDPSLDPSVRDYPFTRGSRIGIDATTKFKGFEFVPLARPPQSEMQEVEKMWQEYGL